MDKDDQFENAVDPGEPPVVVADGSEPTEDATEDGPEAQFFVDEDTGKTYVAFEIDPSDVEEETPEEGEEK